MSNFLLSVSTLCFIPTFLPLSSGQAQSQLVPVINSNYNQPCSQSSQCNNHAGLFCIPTPPTGQLRCSCLQNSTTFDEYKGRCVGKVGHPCLFSGNQSFCVEKALCSRQNPHQPDLYYPQSRCFCELNYLGDRNGKCVLASKFGEPCSPSSSKRCDETSGLKCVNGKCLCSLGSEHQYYDPKKDKCVSYIGKNCTGFNSCPENARCDGTLFDRVGRVKRQGQGHPPVAGTGRIPGGNGKSTNAQLTQNFGRFNPNLPVQATNGRSLNETDVTSDMRIDIALPGKCVCDYGFSSTRNGKCLASYRQPCSQVQQCNYEDNLQCLDGSCNCKSPLHQVYDPATKRCLNLVGSKCDSLFGPSCIPNSHCIGGTCVCKDGYTRTPFRACQLGFGRICENGDCNGWQGLACKIPSNSNSSSTGKGKKVCGCLDDSLLYSSQVEACVSLVGSPCGKITQIGEKGEEVFQVRCEPFAKCVDEGEDSRGQRARVCVLADKDL